MKAKFIENNKQLEVSISGYEFEFNEKDDVYTANWLIVVFEYTDGDITKTYKDSCIQTVEIEELIDGIDKILKGEETGFITDFMEPYLKISITKVEEIYALQIRFVYDTADGYWKDLYISQGLNTDELNYLNNIFKKWLDKYPYRETEN